MSVAVADRTERTPWHWMDGVWLKRDDLYMRAGQRGGKVRTCWHLATEGKAQGGRMLVTAGSRSSPQVSIVAHVAQRLGMRCVAYVPAGALTPELEAADRTGAILYPVRPGYNSVLRARARDHCLEDPGCVHVPFGMECQEAVDATAAQVPGIPPNTKTLYVPVGSGMSLAGILWGLAGLPPGLLPRQVVGVCVGADPERRLDTWAPPLWRAMVTLERSPAAYDEHVEGRVGPILLDPVYEAKVVPYLRHGDALWVVGVRAADEH